MSNGLAPDNFLRPWALPLGPQVPGPSTSFPTVMTWYVGTTSSLVATMTRRSGSGTAGDRHGLPGGGGRGCRNLGQGLGVLVPFFGHGREGCGGILGSEAKELAPLADDLCWAQSFETQPSWDATSP
jgi:hypothetical protein